MSDGRGYARRRNGPILGTVAISVLVPLAMTAMWGPSAVAGGDAAGDVMAGWRVFNEKRCIDCHAIWDQGGRLAPDLGRIRSRSLSTGQLAGVMWNHIPKMMARMKQVGHAPAAVSEAEMSDLFALIYFVRQLDEPGDPVRGETVLRDKGCGECHSIDTFEGGVGPDLAQWGSYANPIIWAQMMWEHAPVMERAMKQAGMNWPKLEGTDLIHIVAYVRSAGTSGEKTYLRPGSVELGRRLFGEKRCDSCHPGRGPDLSRADLPGSVGALAARMWNHAPEMSRVMREREVPRFQVSPQELADLLTFLLTLRDQRVTQNPARGERVFLQKRCAQCHESDNLSEEIAPSLRQMSRSATPVAMAAAMWNHGETMLERMTEAGLAWPVFAEDEMADLLAYLRDAESTEERE